MIIKNRTCSDVYNSKINNTTGFFFVFIVSLISIIILKNIIATIILSIWIIISAVIAYKNIKKGELSDVYDSNIKNIDIKNNRILFNMADGNVENYSYQKIKQADINIEICETHDPYHPSSHFTTIKNVTMVFSFENETTKQVNIFCFTRPGFINTLKYILKELRECNINITYQGQGNIADIKDHIDYFQKNNKSRLLNTTDTKDCYTLAIMVTIFGPALTTIFAIICMPTMFLMDYVFLFFKSLLFFILIAI